MTLPSWNNTQTKQTILGYVATVAAEGCSEYVPPAERIATFDNDGTLWCDHPIPAQFHGTLHALALLAEKRPELLEQPLYKAAAETDPGWFVPYLNNERLPELPGMTLKAAAGETQAAHEAGIGAWLETARHPRFGKPYTKMVSQPMVQLLDHLRDNGFRTFIVSGGGMDFVCLFSEEVYGVPRANVLGVYLQHELAGPEKEPNWLPAPKGRSAWSCASTGLSRLPSMAPGHRRQSRRRSAENDNHGMK